MPDLSFGITEADVLPFAADPTILFKLLIKNAAPGERIRSILLRAQIRIEPTRRHYEAEEERRLVELFGEPQRWGSTVRTLLWSNASAIVGEFATECLVELPITCTYDFEVTQSKYFDALQEGLIPLIFLFSGTVFYTEGDALQISQIPWEKEARYEMPVRLWKQMMERYFPNSAWLRVRKDVFDRLYSYRTQNGLPTWEAALEGLLSISKER
jgi:hypothetical protein